MSDTGTCVDERGQWNDLPFKLPPLSYGGRVKKALTDLFCLVGMTVAKGVRNLRGDREAVTPQKILVVRRGGLGDVLMATPLLRALREHFPSARIYFLTSKQAAAGLDGCPWIDRTFEVPSSMKEWLPLLRRLRKEKVDTAFVLHRFFAPSLVTLCAGIPQRLGFDWGNHGFVLTGSIPFSAARSQTMQIGQLLTLVGKPAADDNMEFPVSNEAIRCARETLRRWGFDSSKPLVGIHPGGGETAGSSDPAKRWLPERFGALASLLIQRNGVQVILLQGPGDKPFVDETLRNSSAAVLGVASGLPLTVFASLIRECDVVVVNDTGPMHLAASQKVPTVAILGPTHPGYTPPRGRVHKVIWAGVPCSPCYNPEEYTFGKRSGGRKLFDCWRGTHECMSAVTAEDVYEVVVQQIHVFENAGQ